MQRHCTNTLHLEVDPNLDVVWFSRSHAQVFQLFMVRLGRAQCKGALPSSLCWPSFLLINSGLFPSFLLICLFFLQLPPCSFTSIFRCCPSQTFLGLSNLIQTLRIEGLGIGSPKRPTLGTSWGKSPTFTHFQYLYVSMIVVLLSYDGILFMYLYVLGAFRVWFHHI